MKAFSLLAISGLFASSFAAPTPLVAEVSHGLNVVPAVVDTVGDAAAPVTNTVDTIPVAGSLVGTAADAVNEVAPLKRAAGATQVVTILQSLHTTIISHTTVINSTVTKFTSSSESQSQSSQSTVVGNLIVNELTAISIAVNNAVSAISPLQGTITATTDEVTEIAEILFNIIAEIVYTVLSVLQSLGIQSLLSGLLISLTGVIATLLHIVDIVVGGVLAVVGGLINVPGVVGAVEGVLDGLVGGILSGNLTSLLPIAL